MLPILVWLMSLCAWATDLEFGYSPSLSRGERPMFSVRPARQVAQMVVRIRAGAQTYEFERSGLPAGQDVRFHWAIDASVTEAHVYVRAVFVDGYVAEVEVPVSYTYGAQLRVDLSRASADLKSRTLTVQVSQPVVRAEIKAFGARKRLLDARSVVVSGGPGDVVIPWVGDPKEVVLLEVELHSARAWAGFSYSPWMLSIPHDDVLFATGRSEIPPDEVGKLEAVLVQLNEVVERYGSVVPVKLYIGGCTDTVGASGANDQLSQRRARSIAAWFQARGYDQPIFYYGFGERWLSVQTPDEVDNSANRRAVYIVAANPPPQSGGVPSARWMALIGR